MPIDKEPWWDIEERRIKESKQDVPKKGLPIMLKIVIWLIILGFASGFFLFLYEIAKTGI